MNKVLRHDKNEFLISELEIAEGFKILDKNKEYEINIIDKNIISSVIKKKFDKQYKKFLKQNGKYYYNNNDTYIVPPLPKTCE